MLSALSAYKDAQADEERKRQLLVREANDRTRSLADLRKQLQVADAKLQAKKQAIKEHETLLTTKRDIGSMSLAELGAGCRSCGGAAAKKNRLAVLDKLARLGNGVSEAQKIDFMWFKEAWDTAMVAAHGAEWPATFAGWAQKVVNDHDAGHRTAFSQFMHSETVRVLSGTVAVAFP